MTILTAQGHRVETLDFNGRSTPYRDIDQMVVLRVAVNGRVYPPWQIPAPTWEEEAALLKEPEFWQNIADAAFTMGDAVAMLR